MRPDRIAMLQETLEILERGSYQLQGNYPEVDTRFQQADNGHSQKYMDNNVCRRLHDYH